MTSSLWPVGVSDGAGNAGTASVGCRNWPTERTWPNGVFKGIPFAVVSHQRGSGRRAVTHEYPSREYWDNEDLGMKFVSIDVRGYTYGDEADRWADVLFAACSSPLRGALTLPGWTHVPSARCLQVSVEYSAETQGRYNFEMRFVLDDPPPSEYVTTGSLSLLAGIVDEGVNMVVDAARAEFLSTTSPSMPTVAYTAASDIIKIVGRHLRRIAQQVPMTLDNATKIQAIATTMIQQSESIAFSLRTRSNERTTTRLGGGQENSVPYQGYFSFIAMFEKAMLLAATGARAKDSSQLLALALTPMLSLRAADDVISHSTSSLSEQNVLLSFTEVVRRDALAYQIMLLVGVSYSIDHIADLEKKIFRRLRSATDDSAGVMRNALDSLMARWIKYRDQTLSVSRRITVMNYMPVAVVATQVYNAHNALERDREIMLINRLRHPLFVDSAIEVPR